MKKYVMRIVSFICGLIVFTAAVGGLDYMYVPADESWMDHWYRLLFNSYYAQDNIDNLFIGTSHVHNDVDPYILDDINGMNNFNMSSPGMRWSDIYFLVRQADKDHDLKHVYLECYYENLAGNIMWDKNTGSYTSVEPMDRYDKITGTWKLTYYMRPCINRFGMQIYCSGNERMLESIFPFTRYRKYMTDWDRTYQIMAYKETDAYRNENIYTMQGLDPDGNLCEISLLPKGYFKDGLDTVRNDNKLYEPEVDLTVAEYGKDDMEFFRRTIRYCLKKNIDLKLFSSPMYELQVISTGDYDRYVDDMRAIADEYGLEYYDFNLVRREYLDLNDGRYYKDVGHLNDAGAALFTPVLWEVLNSTPEENAARFYDTYEEKLQSGEPEIYGLYYTGEGRPEKLDRDGNPLFGAKTYRIASNRKDMEYMVVRSLSDSDESTEDPVEIVQEFGSNDRFTLPTSEHGRLWIYGQGPGYECELETVYVANTDK